MRVPVLCAVPTADEAALVAALDAPATGLTVVRRCADLAEVVALGLAEVAAVAVLAADLPGLDRAALLRLRWSGVRAVLLATEGDVARCRALGAEAVLPLTAPAADVVRAARAAAAAGEAGAAAGAAGAAGGATPADAAPGAAAPLSTAPRAGEPLAGEGGPDGGDDVARPGRLVAVWGTGGAPGRTTVAACLATALARLGEPTLLVDADTWGPSLAQTLGLLDESAGLAAAVRSASHGLLDEAALARLSPEVEARLRVLTGVSRPDRWRELAPAGLEVVLEVARRVAAWTVVDCAAPIEDDAGGGFEAMLGPRRNAATRGALAAADVVLVVGAGEPVGIQRLVHALTDLDEAGLVRADARRLVVVTKVRAGAAGSAPEAAVAEALDRYAGVAEPVLVPDDRPAADRAVLEGRTLLDVAPGSPATAALADLAATVAGRGAVAGPGRRRGRRRRRAAAT